MQLGMIGLGRMGANMVNGWSRMDTSVWCSIDRRIPWLNWRRRRVLRGLLHLRIL